MENWASELKLRSALHRAALRQGPPQLQNLIQRQQGGFMLHDPYAQTKMPPIIKRSAWGLVRVYNRLGSAAQNISTTSDFQRYLPDGVERIVMTGQLDLWSQVLLTTHASSLRCLTCISLPLVCMRASVSGFLT